MNRGLERYSPLRLAQLRAKVDSFYKEEERRNSLARYAKDLMEGKK
jgi:hypothetical protein